MRTYMKCLLICFLTALLGISNGCKSKPGNETVTKDVETKVAIPDTKGSQVTVTANLTAKSH